MDGGHEKVEKYRIRYNFEAYARNIFFLLLSLAFGVAIALVFGSLRSRKTKTSSSERQDYSYFDY